MRGKTARKLRKIAEKNTVGMTPERTRQAYQQLKPLYKTGAIK